MRGPVRSGRWHAVAAVATGVLLALSACGAKDDPGTVGTWRLGAPMLVPRTRHSLTLLPSGLVLAAGGYQAWGNDSPVPCSATAELYDPSTGTWRATAPMGSPRCDQAAVLLEDGRVLVAGGDPELAYGTWFGDEDWWSIPSASAELFDPATETWTPAAAMHHPRDLASMNYNMAHRLADGTVLVVGQWYSPSEGTHGALAERYDPATDTWAEAGDMPGAATGPTVVLSSGQVLSVGGMVLGDTTGAVSIYDPATKSTRLLTPLANPRFGHNLNRLGTGKLLLSGGCTRGYSWSCPGAVPLEGLLFDPATETWSTTAPMLHPRNYASATTLPSGRVLVAGGNTQLRSGAGPLDPYLAPGAEVYDPWLDRWSPTPVLPHYLNEGGAMVLLPSGEVLMTGGTLFDLIATSYGISAVQLYRE